MPYGRQKLYDWAMNGGVSPFDPQMIGDRSNEHCIDVRLGWLQAHHNEQLAPTPDSDRFGFLLQPNEFRLGLLLEYVKMPLDAIGEFTIRSEWAKRGLGQALSKDIKAGWTGYLVVEFKNYHHERPLMLSYGDVIGQISLHGLE